MKRLFTFKRGLVLLLALTLVFAAGCQAVAGVNLNGVLKNVLKTTSMEGKQSVEVQLLVNEKSYEGIPEEELALIKLFSKVKVDLNNVKVQDPSNASYDGKLVFGDQVSIGFSAKMSTEALVVEIEGAKAPFVFDLTEEGLAAFTGLSAADLSGVTPEQQQSITALGYELIDSAGSYLIDNLPNPDKLSVATVNEPINGVSTSLAHIKAELDGPAIWAWIKKYVDALAADQKGLETFVSTVVNIVSENEAVWAAIGESNPFAAGALDGVTKEELIKELTKQLVEGLGYLQEQIKLFEKEDPKTLAEIFNKDSYIKADLYVDSKLDVRKQILEASFKINGADLIPIDGIVLRSETEQWNVNGKVTSDKPVVPEQSIAIADLFDAQGYQVLRQFDEKSVVYDLLKNKLHIGKQEVRFYGFEDYPAIVTPTNVTIVPLRDVAEQLGAEVGYNKQTKNVTVFDEATNTTIVLKEGSNQVTINGKAVKWQFPATSIDGALYVPARNFADALKAKVRWEKAGGDFKTFVVDREVS
ncbi:copper amine oxidase N-terminal domain-containing protein [Paenibacillus sp. NPDC058071]|uniref:copper amine oxidase N-terminal domain-containing protein n=1 Tax=Paenibacillus sp. NPDC058071 TaxID=3346326 RepID=UPI0036D90FE0